MRQKHHAGGRSIPASAPSSSALPDSIMKSPDPTGGLAARRGGVGWGVWVRRIFAGNPFYFCSAAFLLYAVYRLSIDPRMFLDELTQLLFNFGSLQFYEILLVITAIFLVRR